MRPSLTSTRVLRTGQPLKDAGIMQVCPSVFAETPHGSVSPRYQYVPTVTPMRALQASGWGVYEASQQRSRSVDRDPYTKHMLRLRRLSDVWGDKPSDHIIRQDIPELILINAHDGSASYHLKAGIFRLVCANGLMVGTTIAGFTVRHTVGPQTSQEVLEAGEKIVTEKFPAMLEHIERFKAVRLTRDNQYRLARRAIELKYKNATLTLTVKPEDFLAVRRPEDEDPTLWNVLNRVQESAIYGGFESKSFGWGRKTVARPVERVTEVTRINMALWDEAETIAKESA